ncbi:hypothetical protein AB2M62_12905 [Sphingomonas sp. MMS12-HWE2-04]|uniref:hypothetical protein n=1 Tax=Sphingomonas sp. MMS12-HWE2-04 TaxID=3234199 RepID=UPI00384D50A1
MIRRHMIMSATVATLALSSCSGGNDDASPTPTPTSTPTPTPTASPTYTAFPLTTATEFSTINAATSFTGDPATSAVTLGAASTEMLSSRFAIATSPTIASATYVVRENTEESRFVVANATVQPAPAAEEFVFRTTDTATAGKFAQAEFLNNTISTATLTSNTALQYTNVSYVNWYRADATAGAYRFTSGVFGYNTVTTDMPKTGVQAYSSTVQGRIVNVTGGASSVLRVSGTVTTSVNFSTGLVDLTLNLTTIPAAGGAGVAFGTFTAQGAIPVGQNQFTGSFTGGGLTGTLTGGFFGSAAKEIGISFAANGTVGGGSQRIVGTVLGKK